jgi:deazaflavin-dependent oxidoreductase (nitroreductase family)
MHGLASKRLLVLRHVGRKSGRAYTIPLVYVTHADRIYCVTRNTQWWKNAVSVPEVTIWLRGQPWPANAERVASDASDTRAAFAKFLSENPGTAELLYNVRVDARAEPDAGDIEREVHNSNVIRLAILPAL